MVDKLPSTFASRLQKPGRVVYGGYIDRVTHSPVSFEEPVGYLFDSSGARRHVVFGVQHLVYNHSHHSNMVKGYMRRTSEVMNTVGIQALEIYRNNSAVLKALGKTGPSINFEDLQY